MFFINYQNYQHARDTAWRILIDCNVKALPVCILDICNHLHIRLFSYADGEKIIKCYNLAEHVTKTDGFLIFLHGMPCIFYDNQCTRARQRFTVAHEIGHLVLQHVSQGQITAINREVSPDDNPYETAAN